MEVYKICWKEPSLMGVKTLLFQTTKMKKEKSLMSLEEICCNIRDYIGYQ